MVEFNGFSGVEPSGPGLERGRICQVHELIWAMMFGVFLRRLLGTEVEFLCERETHIAIPEGSSGQHGVQRHPWEMTSKTSGSPYRE